MVTATDKDNEKSEVTIYTNRPLPPINPLYAQMLSMQRAMANEIYRYIREDVTDHSLLSQVVDSCYTRDAVSDYLGSPIGNHDEGYKLRLTTVRMIISKAITNYVMDRKVPC